MMVSISCVVSNDQIWYCNTLIFGGYLIFVILAVKAQSAKIKDCKYLILKGWILCYTVDPHPPPPPPPNLIPSNRQVISLSLKMNAYEQINKNQTLGFVLNDTDTRPPPSPPFPRFLPASKTTYGQHPVFKIC